MSPLRCPSSYLPLALLAFSRVASAGFDDPTAGGPWANVEGFTDGSDLYNFVTRPDLKPPFLLLSPHHPSSITPGHIFVSPYSTLVPAPHSPKLEHVPCQTGPAIYNGTSGELIWSGACEGQNTNAWDFKPVIISGHTHMSFIRRWYSDHALHVLNDKFETVWSGGNPAASRQADIHEFSVIPTQNGGMSGISTWLHPDKSDIFEDAALGKVGFSTFEMKGDSDAAMSFNWDPLDHDLTLTESQLPLEGMPFEEKIWYDYFHINSVDLLPSSSPTSSEETFLISGRHMNTIYHVSSPSGKILWRLGGTKSDFRMDAGVPFHWAHDARLRERNATHMIISLFDNGNIGEYRFENGTSGHYAENSPTAIYQGDSSVKLISLDLQSMRASLLRHIPRPDGQRTGLCGNADFFAPESAQSSNVFSNWVDRAYMTEHDAQDRLVLEAKFLSERFHTYRAHKAPFVGRPADKPVLKVVLMRMGGREVVEGMYVSWNGDTEVRSWAFHGGDAPNSAFDHLETIERQGFESSFIYAGAVRYAYVEGLDANGQSLGRSETFDVAAVQGENGFVLHSTAPPLPGSSSTMTAGVGGLVQQGLKAASANSMPWILVLVLIPFACVGIFHVARQAYQILAGKTAWMPWAKKRHQYAALKEEEFEIS